MGYSRWDTDATASLYASTVSTRSTKSTREIFSTYGMPEGMDPAKVVLRESRDSDLNPSSTPIIIGLDVTGSMGIIAEKMARGKLGDFMDGIFAHRPVTDPHVMVMAIGDANCDRAPLQVSQFEADIKIDSSLQAMYLEGGGGGNDYESYDLPWYFAASRTSTDAFEKRGTKGYLFTIGDEMPPPNEGYSSRILERVFGPSQHMFESSAAALQAAQEKYHVFHIVVEQGSYARTSGSKVIGAWREKLGKRAIPLSDWEQIADVMTAAIEINEGEDPESVIERRQSPAVRAVLTHAFLE